MGIKRKFFIILIFVSWFIIFNCKNTGNSTHNQQIVPVNNIGYLGQFRRPLKPGEPGYQYNIKNKIKTEMNDLSKKHKQTLIPMILNNCFKLI